MGVKINTIKIKGIQSIRDPLIINLDKKVTRIKGHNASGKSAIIKAVKLFSGLYVRDDIKSLVSKSIKPRDTAKVQLYLSDNTVLEAEIINKSNVVYRHYVNGPDHPKVWNGFSPEITDILGWKYIEGAEFCLNFKDKACNIFVDTKTDENAEIMNFLCQDRDIETRIENLEVANKQIGRALTAIKQLRMTISAGIDLTLVTRAEIFKKIYDEIDSICRLNISAKVITVAINNKLIAFDLPHYEEAIITLKEIKLLNEFKNILEYRVKRQSLELLKREIIIYRLTEFLEHKSEYTSVIDTQYSILKSLYKFRTISKIKILTENSIQKEIMQDFMNQNASLKAQFLPILKVKQAFLVESDIRSNFKKQEMQKMQSTILSISAEYQYLKLIENQSKIKYLTSLLEQADNLNKSKSLIDTWKNKVNDFRKDIDKLEIADNTLRNNRICPTCGSRIHKDIVPLRDRINIADNWRSMIC